MTQPVPLHGGQLRHIADRFGIPASQLIDFSANINPEGPPPAVLSTLRSSLEDLSILTAYPDLEQATLKQSIAAYAGVAPENIVVANGFIPLLETALRTLQIRRCLLLVPAFVEYRRSLARTGVSIETRILSSAANFRYDLDALLNGDHDAIILANPQNPSGTLTPRHNLLHFVESCASKNITVFLDEAFIDYTPLGSLTAHVNSHPNLVVFRSVTKFHGIPGLRIAYAVTNETRACRIHEDLPPWPITTLAACAVPPALADLPYAERTRHLNETRSARLRADLEALGIHVYPAAANFLLLRLPQAVSVERLWNHLITRHNIVLRDCSNYEGLPPGHLRAAIRTEAENSALVTAIAQSI
jgi:threonine-phosphate decarboxylase